MGYILLLIIGGVVLIGLVVAFMGGRRRPAGHTRGNFDVTPKKPSADEPTPSSSSTATSSQASAAQKRTPPA